MPLSDQEGGSDTLAGLWRVAWPHGRLRAKATLTVPPGHGIAWAMPDATFSESVSLPTFVLFHSRPFSSTVLALVGAHRRATFL